jgi:hypothetical protein
VEAASVTAVAPPSIVVIEPVYLPMFSVATPAPSAACVTCT